MSIRVPCADPPPPADSIPPALARKLLAIMNAVPSVPKDAENSFHGYRYSSDEAIKTALHAALVEHRVLFLPVAQAVLGERTAGKDGKETVTTLQLTYRLVDADTGAYFEASVIGQGSDPLDKGVYKAITGAVKYALLNSFVIPSGNSDADVEHENPAMRAAAERARDARAARPATSRPPATSRDRSNEPRPSGSGSGSPSASAAPRTVEPLSELRAEIAQYHAKLGREKFFELLGAAGYKSVAAISTLDAARDVHNDMVAALAQRGKAGQ